ncbi:uncharacterized protein LOC105700882 isoform X1 [Orussus abietinus]|uniref:uncharacterized protein LOC105700882 isoform X1 n=1 Tax=Orussus abietinus TaxID=222816 RepID=UPI0006250743|nr:uncharacterized protein LOC105700882 isoform X1 [Orussus abietinus]
MKKERVNGQDLAQHIGEEAILLGEVKEINPLGKSVQLRAPDDTIVNVTLPTPINEYCDGYLEVWGTIQSKSTMSCFSYVFFPRTMFKKHDEQQYTDLLTVLHVLGNKRWRVSRMSESF